MPGGAPGLQNQCGADKVPGGFDSHSPPPFIEPRSWNSLMSMDVVLAMTKKTKIIAFCVLIVLGAALLAYGALYHSTNILPQQGGDSAALAKSEPALIKEASVGGVTRDESGKIKQTYTGKAPAACPT